jgi:predicted membrane protein
LRAASLVFAACASVLGLVFPFLLARQATGLNQMILLVMMAGIAGAFIYGAGFQPESRVLRRCIAPAVTWTAMLASLAALAAIR